MFQEVGSGWKRRARIQSSGVGLETAGSCSKQWGRVGNGGLAFRGVGSGLKRRARVQSSGEELETAAYGPSSGVGFKTAGSRSK